MLWTKIGDFLKPHNTLIPTYLLRHRPLADVCTVHMRLVVYFVYLVYYSFVKQNFSKTGSKFLGFVMIRFLMILGLFRSVH